MSAQASFLFFEDLYIMRFEPPTNVNALPAGPEGIAATPTFLRAAGTQFLSSVRQIGDEVDALLGLRAVDRRLRGVVGQLGAAVVPHERHHVVDEVEGLLAGHA